MKSIENKKQKLGRGLSALLGEVHNKSTNLDGGRAVKMIPIEFLQPGKYQPRQQIDSESIVELSQSIAEKGVLQPLLVRPLTDTNSKNIYEIIAGERRWRASQKAQIHEVPVIIEDLNDQETLEIALIENLQRQDLSPLEEAEGYQQLMSEFKHTQSELAKVMGKSRSHVANTLRLLSLPKFIKEMIDDKRLSAGHGRALLGATNLKKLVETVLKQGLNVRQTEKLVKKDSASSRKSVTRTFVKDADTIALERNISDSLGLKVDIKFSDGRGALTIYYKGLSQLDDILARLSRKQKK